MYLSFPLLACLHAVSKELLVQYTETLKPIGNMLLTQPRPLHSSICTAVLSLLTPSPLSPLLSAPSCTHRKEGQRKERGKSIQAALAHHVR